MDDGKHIKTHESFNLYNATVGCIYLCVGYILGISVACQDVYIYRDIGVARIDRSTNELTGTLKSFLPSINSIICYAQIRRPDKPSFQTLFTYNDSTLMLFYFFFLLNGHLAWQLPRNVQQTKDNLDFSHKNKLIFLYVIILEQYLKY